MFTVTAIGLSVWGAAAVRAECIAPGDWWLRDKHVELVFSGRVVTVTRTAGDATRSTFVVDGVWKGDVPARIDLYEWEGFGEVYRVVVGQRYLVGAMRLTWMRMREAVGLGKGDTIAFTQVPCGAPSYDAMERKGVIAALGTSTAPRTQPR
jgi:hypothetical protein